MATIGINRKCLIVLFGILWLGLVFPCLAKEGRLSDDAIASAVQYSQKTGGAGLVIKEKGTVRVDDRADGVSNENRFIVYSITKTLVGLLAMVAESEELLRLNERASDTLVEWKGDPQREDIRIVELLSMTSGLPTGIDALYGGAVKNKNQRALQLKAIASPGGAFCYGPAGFEAFEELLRRKLKSRDGISPLKYMQNRLLNVIGANTRDWRSDAAGNAYFSTGARLTIRQMITLGELLKNHGRYAFRQIIPGKTVADLWRESEGPRFYHMGVWLNQNVGRAEARVIDVESSIGNGKSTAIGFWRNGYLSARAPSDLVAMIGSSGQRVYVCPSRDLVVVRTGRRGGFRDAEFLDRLFK